jgi:anaerobic selenocysteine-containing dehydrogenase
MTRMAAIKIERVSAARSATEGRGETFYPGPSRTQLAAYPPRERWDDWVELDPRAWPQRVERHYMLVPTTCFNCESACGLLAYVDRETLEVRKLEGNPEHPASRGRICAKGPATLNQVTDPDRILFPMRRAGGRGENRWQRVSWDEALDDVAARIRKAILEKRNNEVMYHVGRPGEDGYAEGVLAAWDVDGHNSHTNVCSSGGRAGYQWWMGCDRPSPDHANASVILLVSSQLESGHYFNPHAQRIMEGKKNGAKVVVFDVRLSNTASHADHWLAPWPGSEPAILLAIANHLIQGGLYDREFVRRFWNWQECTEEERPGEPATFEGFERGLRKLYAEYTFAFAERESGVPAAAVEEVARVVAGAGARLSTHAWRSAAAGNLGGWQVSRTLFLLNALLGAVGVPGGTFPGVWNKFVPRPIHTPPPPRRWNELTWPQEFPLAMNEMSFLLPHFLKDGRGRLEVYFSRVYNPVWTNPDGFSWIEAISDESKVGLHVALTPTWNESACFADYVLPVGVGCERHDVHSYETHDAQWLGFRQPVRREAKARLGQAVADTRSVNPGEVWEESELWIDLSWRIDLDGAMGIRRFLESRREPGKRLTVDEYYGWMFESSVPGLPEKAKLEGLTPLDHMRRYGSFEVRRNVGAQHEAVVPEAELQDVRVSPRGRVYTRAAVPTSPNVVPVPSPDPDDEGRRPVGIEVDGAVLRGFPTPSGRLEFFSSTLKAWGWREHAVPTYIRSHVHPQSLHAGEMPLVPTFRLPVQIHTRSANSKWLDEIAHTNPLWVHPADAAKLGVETGDLVRVETRIGHFVVKAWVTEGIRPGVVACSHHMGRWKPDGPGQRQMMATVSLKREGTSWTLRRVRDVGPFASTDADTSRIWWTDAGVHQNLAFPVQPDPVSGMHCWHQAVRVRRAAAEDRYGDVRVDTAKARRAYQEWLSRARPAILHSPDGTRRPWWLLRPLKPAREAYRLPGWAPPEKP